MEHRRILLSINAAWNVVNFRAGLIRALVAAGHEVIVATPEDGSEKDIPALGARFVPLPMAAAGMSPRQDIGLYLRYRRLIRDTRPDIFLGYTVKPNVWGALAAQHLGVPTINNISGLGTAFIDGGLLGGLVVRLYRAALRRSFCVFFQNPDDRDLFVARRLVDPDSTRLLPGSGIALGDFPVSPRVRQHGDGLRFLMVARLLRQKGVVEYVEAARIVRARYPAAQFQLLGPADVANVSAISRAELDGWITEGAIDYLGATGDVRPFIADADVVVLPSYREGLPRTLLEGAAMGKPLIATDVPGCRHIVTDGGNGLLVPVRDAVALAGAFEAMIAAEPCKIAAMGVESRSIVERTFDERVVFAAYLAAIAEAPARVDRLRARAS